jgi:D-alanyl-D-alanine carboxypeptidase
MQKWLAPALDYIPRWMEFQMRMSQQPGCMIAIAHKRRIVLEHAPAAPEARRFMAGEPGV